MYDTWGSNSGINERTISGMDICTIGGHSNNHNVGRSGIGTDVFDRAGGEGKNKV
jgi:hypothetical protein